MNENALLRKIGDAPLSHVEQLLLHEFTHLQQQLNHMKAEGARIKERIRKLECPNAGEFTVCQPHMVSV